MKKIYALFILCCFSCVAFSQPITVTVNATGAPNSFKTGYIDSTAAPVRYDGDLQAHFEATAPLGVKRGWGVFDIKSVVPASATVTSVKVRFTISATANASVAPLVGIYGYVGDLSTVTAPDLVYQGCNGNGIYTGTNLTSANWGGVPATITLPFNASGVGFIQDNVDTMISLGWQCNSIPSQTYTITGEGGSSVTQPQLEIIYHCDSIASVSASAAPNPLCVGTTLSLTGSVTAAGAATYEWNGPNGYTSSSLSPSFVVPSTAATGIYSLTVRNSGGCATMATTASVLVNPTPGPIVGASVVCAGSSTALTDLSGPGTWTSSNPAVFTVGAATGVVTGVSAGTANVTFTISATGCQLTKPITVYAIPGTIGGPNFVCEGGTANMTQAVTTGTWSSSNTLVATIEPLTGLLTSVSSGTITITYSNGCAPDALKTFTVHPVPAPITGPVYWVCADSMITLSDATPGGVWSSSAGSLATVNSTTGVVTGVNFGVPNITYTLPTTCYAIRSIPVNPVMSPTTGANQVCATYSTSLANSSLSGGTWSSGNTNVATIDSFTGALLGVGAGNVTITFSNKCGSSVTYTVTVDPLPAPITGPLGVCNTLTTLLSDATGGGVWSINNTNIATIGTATGLVSSVNPGVVIVTYTLPTTCYMTRSMTVTPPPPAAGIVGLSTVCVGQDITLSQVTGVGMWTTSNVGLATVEPYSGVVWGAGMGSVMITYTIGTITSTACMSTHSVLVRPLAPITGADSICMGTATYLADIVGPGTWTSSVPSVATVHIDSGKVVSVSPGATTVISYTTNTGCVTTKTITVIAIPPNITGTLKTCPGASVRLSDATLGGVWSTANPAVATAGTGGNSGRIYGVFADTVTVYYTVKPGCSISALLTVNPNPLPITGLNDNCATLIDTAYDATPGGVWSVSTPSIITIDTGGIVHALTQGTGTVVYTLTATGCKASANVTIHPLPVPVISYNKYDRTFYTQAYYTSWQWYNDFQGMIPGATSRNVAALYTQNYWVVVTDTFGCVNSSAHYFFDAALLGVDDISQADVKIYPNPANETVYISSSVNVRAVISSIDGKQVMEQANAKEINISGLANGMYFITLFNDDKRMISVQKLIKE